MYVKKWCNTLLTPAGVGHKWTERVLALVATNGSHWMAKIALKVSHVGRNRSLVANTSRCGEGIKGRFIFHGLKYFEVFIFFEIHYRHECGITRISRKRSIWCHFIMFETNFEQWWEHWNSTCTPPATSSKMCRLFLRNNLATWITWLCRSMCFSFNGYGFFPSQRSKLVHGLNHFRLNLCKVMELCTWPCMCPYLTPELA